MLGPGTSRHFCRDHLGDFTETSSGSSALEMPHLHQPDAARRLSTVSESTTPWCACPALKTMSQQLQSDTQLVCVQQPEHLPDRSDDPRPNGTPLAVGAPDTAVDLTAEDPVGLSVVADPGAGASGDDVSRPPTDEGRLDCEVVGGYRVHPLASMFPLLEGDAFEQFVESILGTQGASPVELHEGLLIDGRNRVRAIEELRRRGHDLEVRTTQWEPVGDETVEDHIVAMNIHRRHLTDDQRAMLIMKMEPLIREAAAARQAATRFGGPKPPVDTSSCPPSESTRATRSRQEKTAASTNGQMAALAGVSAHKIGQAKQLCDAVAHGAASQEEVDAVLSGKKRLCEATPGRPKRARPAPKPAACPPAETMFEDGDDLEGGPVAQECDQPPPTEEAIGCLWEQLKSLFAVVDHHEVRRILAEIIASEQDRFDRD